MYFITENEWFHWLKTNTEPEATVNEYWFQSHNARRILLLVNHIPICEYLQKFLCLRLQEAKNSIYLLHYMHFKLIPFFFIYHFKYIKIYNNIVAFF